MALFFSPPPILCAAMARVSDYDVLKRHHRFVRDDDDDQGDQGASGASWEDRVARNYEAKLFREYALIDLKHYKSNRYALRWRTAGEVVDGVGAETCAGLRCARHRVPGATDAFELPFVYAEAGERRETTVRVRLCRRCAAKLTWKPDAPDGGRDRREREGRRRGRRSTDRERDGGARRDRTPDRARAARSLGDPARRHGSPARRRDRESPSRRPRS